VGCKGVDWINLVDDTDTSRVKAVVNWGCIKGTEFLGWLKNS
jgi:hypothetical protein